MQNTNRAQESGYKASLTREQFLFHEMRIVAKQMVQGEDLASMIQIIAANNLFQYPTERMTAGMVHKLDQEYFKKVEAIEFAVKYDDGKNPSGFEKADVVIIGVSRTSKTPLSMFLAYKKIKAANLPLVPEVPLPEELFKIPAKKIVGLIIDPFKLNNIRSERLRAIGLEDEANYASIERIQSELEYAKAIMRRLHCQVLDVSNKSIEETASLVMQLIDRNRASEGK